MGCSERGSGISVLIARYDDIYICIYNCTRIGCSPEDLQEAMGDREGWRERVRDICADGVTWWWWWWWWWYILKCLYVCVCLPTHHTCSMRHEWSLTGLNLEFSFYQTGYLTKVKEFNLPYYLLIAGKRKLGYIPFPLVLALWEMQTVSCRFCLSWVFPALFLYFLLLVEFVCLLDLFIPGDILPVWVFFFVV